MSGSLWQVLAGWSATVAILALGAGLVWARDGRVALLALALTYTFAGAHLAALTRPEMAAVQMLTGGLAASLLWMGWARGGLPWPRPGRGGGGPLRLVSAALLTLTAVGVGLSFDLPGLPVVGRLWGSQAVAVVGLVLAGAAAAALHRAESLPAAAGLLFLLLGGQIWALAMSPSLALGAACCGLELLVAATAGHLLRVAAGPPGQGAA